MVKPEFTGKRDLIYNRWHRTIGQPYYMLDLDSVEWRSGRGVVAIIERSLLTNVYPVEKVLEFKKFEIKVASEISQKLGVPSFLVFYTDDLQTFHVYKIQNEQASPQATMDNGQYSQFLRSL